MFFEMYLGSLPPSKTAVGWGVVGGTEGFAGILTRRKRHRSTEKLRMFEMMFKNKKVNYCQKKHLSLDLEWTLETVLK